MRATLPRRFVRLVALVVGVLVLALAAALAFAGLFLRSDDSNLAVLFVALALAAGLAFGGLRLVRWGR